MKYRPEIDGLRALAVVPVILFHAGYSLFEGGYVGVDVFFVISGYLITSILMHEISENTFSIANFYERRARRLLPAMYFVVACSIPLALFTMLPTALRDFGQSLAATGLFVANFYFFLEADYFDSAAELKPMLHMWSLAVEEQFYILFPPLLAFLWALGQRMVMLGLISIFVLSLAAAEIVLRFDPGAAFYLLPTRAWELAIGAIVALYLRKRVGPTNRTLQEAGGILGITLIVFSILFFDAATPFPGFAALVPTAGTALIILFAGPQTFAGQLLGTRALVGIGLISYSAYLWHQPLFAFARHYALIEPQPWVMPLLAAFSLMLAWVSWRFVERPFRAKSMTRRTIVKVSISGILATIAVGFALHFLGLKFEGPAVSRAPMIAEYRYDNAPLREASWKPLRELSGSENYGVDNNPFDRKNSFDPNDPRPRLLIIGNSHSKDIFNLARSSKAVSETYQIARFGLQIADFPQDIRTTPLYRQADVILLASLYSGRDAARLPTVIEAIRSDGKRVAMTSQQPLIETYKHGMLNLADVRVIEALQAGERSLGTIKREVDQSYFLKLHDERAQQLAAPARSAIESSELKFPDLIVLDRLELICDYESKRCLGVDERLGKAFYDGGHYSLLGARIFAERADVSGWFVPLLDVAQSR